MAESKKKGSYRFTFGPWNISMGADPFGPPVRKEVAFAAKIREYKKLGFDGVQFHDDDAVEAAIGRADIFGGFLDGRLMGIAGFAAQEGTKHAHKGLLWAMYVRSAARKSGLGKILVAAVLDHARGRVEMVQLTVVSENEAARRLYEAMGLSRTVMKSGRSNMTGDITTRF